jgi:hypothetical protein
MTLTEAFKDGRKYMDLAARLCEDGLSYKENNAFLREFNTFEDYIDKYYSKFNRNYSFFNGISFFVGMSTKPKHVYKLMKYPQRKN